MAWEAVSGSARLMSYAAGTMLRRMMVSLEAGPFARWRWPGPVPERLVIAPQDIRTADPTRAADIYAGIFVFDGKVAETGGRSPFDLDPPSESWSRHLHSFSWLRHLRAADNALTRQNARALVADWIAQEASAPSLAFEAEVMARRVIAWITQSPLILEEADRAFYRRFLRSLVRQVRRLRISFLDAGEGYPRLLSAIAVAEAALSMDGQSRLIRQAAHRLDQELDRQILPDGGHVSRHPGLIIDLLADLLPLKQAFTARGLSPSATLIGACDRMMPMLRFFRHMDGSFAHFNGMGSTPADLVATVLAHDDARGRPVRNALHAGYQRLELGSTVVLMDTGRPPPLPVSQSAHAGFLSFEMSSGHHRFVVNCGLMEGDERWRQIARTTAAHSTLVLEDTSSARFLQPKRLRRRIGTVMLPGPQDPAVSRDDRDDSQSVTARHDGYAAGFGVVHQRSLVLSDGGAQLVGSDRLVATAAGQRERDRFAIRFHLHPAIKATRTAGGDVLLVAPDGEAFLFSSPMIEPELAESVYLSAVHGRRRTIQIVVSGRVRVTPEITWSFTRAGEGTRPRPARPRPGADGGADLFD